MKNCFYFFNKTSRTTNSILVERFQLRKSLILSKFGQKLHKNVKNLNFITLKSELIGIFNQFRSQFEAFFISK